MSYTWIRECYGLPNEYFDLGIPDDAVGDLDLWAHGPGGGFGLRDSRVVIDPDWAGLRPIARELYREDAVEDPNPFYQRYAMAVVTIASTSTQQFSRIDVPAWSGSARNYTIDDLVIYQNLVYRCRGTHVSAADNNPTNVANPVGGGSAGIRLWQPLALNTASQPQDASLPQIPNRGEMDPGFGLEQGLGFLRFTAYIKKHAKRLGLTGNVIIHGSSAGATAAAQAMAIGSLDYDEASGTLLTPFPNSGPDAVMLDDTFINFRNFATVDRVNQGQLKAFMASLYGDPALQTWADWAAYDQRLKDMVDPLYIAKETRKSCPMYVSAPLSSRDDKTPDIVFNGNDLGGGSAIAPDVHHASMGWELFSVFNRPDSVFLEQNPSVPGSYNRVTPAGTTQVSYVVDANPNVNAQRARRALALDYLTWMEGIFASLP